MDEIATTSADTPFSRSFLASFVALYNVRQMDKYSVLMLTSGLTLCDVLRSFLNGIQRRDALQYENYSLIEASSPGKRDHLPRRYFQGSQRRYEHPLSRLKP